MYAAICVVSIMARGRRLVFVLVLALLGQAMAVPVGVVRLRRGYFDNELDSGDVGPAGLVYRDLVAAESGIRQTRQNAPSDSENKDTTTVKPSSYDDDDDDDDFAEPMNTAPSTGGSGSNIFSLLNLANAFFPGSSASSILLRKLIREYLLAYQARQPIRRSDVKYNEIQLDDVLKPPPLQKEKLEIEEDENDNSESDSSSETEEDNDDDDNNNDEDNDDENDDDGDDNNGAEESMENDDKGDNENGDSKSKQDPGDENDSDYDDDEPPGGGDGQGGGILGLLAGLSGGENGESDLGSLLAAVSGIVVNLSGDGVDINAIIAAGLGLFVGLLSEGEQNPGEIIASYLLTSLDTITGGGSKNNGKFFGKFLSTLITGSSAGGDPEADGGEGMKTKDSAGFFASLLMGLLGEMSKGSSGGSSRPW